MPKDANSGRWTKTQHILFMEGLKLHGKNWKKIQQMLGTRSGAQIRSHAQKFFNRLQCQNGPKSEENFDQKINNSTQIQQNFIQCHYEPLPKCSFFIQHLYAELLTAKDIDDVVYSLIENKLPTSAFKNQCIGFTPYKQNDDQMNQLRQQIDTQKC